jgi:hypothetical protein
MASGIQFTNYVPTSLVVNSPSPTLAAEAVTGLPIPTGAFPGNAFYLSEQQANQLSPTGTVFHAGWYMVVQVDAGATAANIALGYVGHQSTIAGSNTAPGALLVTDASHGLGIGINPVVFLGAVTPGNYTIVQVAGDGVLFGSAAVAAVATVLSYANTGKVAATSATYSNSTNASIAGISKAITGAAGLVRSEIAFAFGIL